MSRRGGYQLISFENVELDGEGVEHNIPGTYEALEGNYRKRVVLTGLIIDGKEYNDTTIEATTDGSKYTFTAYGHNFEVTDQDQVKATKIEVA